MAQKSSFGALFQLLKKLAYGFFLILTFPLILISKLESLKVALASVFKPFQIVSQNLLAVMLRLINPCITLGTSISQLYVRSQTGFYTAGKCVATKLSTLFYVTGMFIWNIFAKVACVLFVTKRLQDQENNSTSSKHGFTTDFKRSS